MDVLVDVIGDKVAVLKLGSKFVLAVPDLSDRNPRDWWMVEAATGIASERIVSGWAKAIVGTPTLRTLNPPLNDTALILQAELKDVDEATVDTISDLRRLVVRQRMFGRGLLPFLFIGRPDQAHAKVRALLSDVFPDTLYTTTGEKVPLVPAIIYRVRGRTQILRLNTEDLALSVLTRTIRFAKPGHPPRPVEPPRYIARDLITMPEEWTPINGVVRLPSIQPDGTIPDRIGFYPGADVWYEPEDCFKHIKTPDVPTADQIEWARQVLWIPFAEFPFVDGPASAMAIIIERVAFAMLAKHPRPLHIIDAPAVNGVGSGKTLLGRTIGAIVKGSDPSMEALGKTEEETQKSVTAFLRHPEDEIHLIDNVSRVLASDTLARLATSTSMRGRILGVSEAPMLPNIATWIFTLNGATMSDDIARRSCVTRLNAGVRNAYSRKSNYALKLPDWAIENRALIIEAALILVRSWIVAGCPDDPELTGLRGSFEQWLHVVGGILYHARIPGLKTAFTVADSRKLTSQDDNIFLTSVASTYGSSFKSTRDLCDLASALGVYADYLEGQQGTWRERRFAENVLSRLDFMRTGRLWGLPEHVVSHYIHNPSED